ncbi:hypothetical protein niasHS_016628 [Heterodera schachtii]|uniref:C6 domain-containing protein n=1 Tax=Heterodera schachtii TaxID=97005 RepID=A0ABD2HSP0_HETSC
MWWSFFLQYRLTTTTTIIIIISSMLAVLVGKLQCCHPEGAGAAGGGAGAAGGGAGGAGGTAADGIAARSAGAASADTANAVAASAAAGGPCVACTTDTLAVLNVANANAAGLATSSTSAPTSTPSIDASGCRTVTPTCPGDQVLLISVPTVEGTEATDYEVYMSGSLTLICDAQTRWLEMNGAQAGTVVNGYACLAVGTDAEAGAPVVPESTVAIASTAAPDVAASVAVSVASAAGGGGSCTACTKLAVLTKDEIPSTRLAEEPVDQVGTSGGCATRTPTCPEGETVNVRVTQENNQPILETYRSLTITLICNEQSQWVSVNGARPGRPVTAYACATPQGAGAIGTPVTKDATAAASAAAGRCSGCDPNLGRVSPTEARTNHPPLSPPPGGSGLCEAIAVTAATSGVITAPNNCQVLPLICKENEVVTLHVILKNGGADYSNYDATADRHIELDCNSQGKWLVPLADPNKALNPTEHFGLEVDRYSCVASDQQAAARRKAAGNPTDCNVRF